MSYLGLDLDNLHWEIKSLIENNYRDDLSLEERFNRAEEDILGTFKDIIGQNKEYILKELMEREQW